jgi:hypothetical protein
MARISLNIDQETFDSTNTDFAPVPEGKYKVTVFEVTDGEVKTGPNKGKQRINVQFRIADGELAPDGSKQGNRRLFAGINTFKGRSQKTGEETLPFDLVGIVKALGGNADDLENLDTDDWLGEELEVTVVHEEKMTKESGYTESYEPARFREVVKGYRSLHAAETAAVSSATVKAGGKAKASAGAFSL